MLEKQFKQTLQAIIASISSAATPKGGKKNWLLDASRFPFLKNSASMRKTSFIWILKQFLEKTIFFKLKVMYDRQHNI